MDPGLGRSLTDKESQTLRSLALSCGAIMGSCVVLAAAAYFVAAQDAGEDAVDPMVPNVLLGAAIVPLLGSSIIRSALLRSSGTEPVARWFVANLVSFAMREGAAVIGFVVSFLTHEPVWSAALSAMAVFGMALGFPSKERYLAWRRGV